MATVTTTNAQSAAQLSPKQFHIFGNGISFSISPTIHNAGFTHHGLAYTYDIRESPTIDDVSQLIRSDEFGGASVTMPHKLHVAKYCHEQTDTAKAIGAINTLIVENKQGKRVIIGDNTDWSGLFSIMSTYSKQKEKVLNTGLVIGAGGASRAALYAMHRAGVRTIYIHNRTAAKAEAVRDAFKPLFEVIIVGSLGDLPNKPDLIVGTVPAATTTESQFQNIFGPEGLCIDMSYKPRHTPLLIAAQKQRAWATVSGVEVLLAQAFDQYRLWTGKEPPKEIMKEAVQAHESRLAKLS